MYVRKYVRLCVFAPEANNTICIEENVGKRKHSMYFIRQLLSVSLLDVALLTASGVNTRTHTNTAICTEAFLSNEACESQASMLLV